MKSYWNTPSNTSRYYSFFWAVLATLFR